MKFDFLRHAAMGAVVGTAMIASGSDAFALAYYPVEEVCPYYQDLEEGMPVDYDYWRFNQCADTQASDGFWHWLLKHFAAK